MLKCINTLLLNGIIIERSYMQDFEEAKKYAYNFAEKDLVDFN